MAELLTGRHFDRQHDDDSPSEHHEQPKCYDSSFNSYQDSLWTKGLEVNQQNRHRLLSME